MGKKKNIIPDRPPNPDTLLLNIWQVSQIFGLSRFIREKIEPSFSKLIKNPRLARKANSDISE